MITTAKLRVAGAPTPMAGLALGIGSLGWSWQNVIHGNFYVQYAAAAIASVLLLVLLFKFCWHPKRLWDDLAHPVVGSVVPTFAMATMVVSHSVLDFSILLGQALWCFAVAIHILFFFSFAYHRLKDFKMHHMVPSWFVPPIGIIVADVAFPGAPFHGVAEVLLVFGMVSYAIMLPAMMYRLIFCGEVPDAAKPTIAIMAAPASLSLAGYLSITANPSPVIVGLLGGIALLMTVVIYLAFFRLMRLPFSPGYAAFTFPMVISATAMFKVSHWMGQIGVDPQFISQVRTTAMVELIGCTFVVAYAALRYALHYRPWLQLRHILARRHPEHAEQLSHA